MRRPPPLNEAIYFPITAGVAALAIVAMWQKHNGADIDLFMFGCDNWWSEPWRFITPAVFHGGWFHLIFNLCWLWVFGTQVEGTFGHGRTLAIYVFLAAGSTAAEEALFQGGIGLSGVVYGLFGMLWVLSRYDRRFHNAVDKNTVQWMVGWFFFCIILTVTDIMPIANAAHGMGCVLGALLGLTIVAQDRLRQVRNASILAAVFLVCMLGGTVARPYVNLSDSVGSDFARWGYKALKDGDNRRGAVLYEKAITTNQNVPDWWHNLGCAYQRLGQFGKAAEAFRRENELMPATPDK